MILLVLEFNLNMYIKYLLWYYLWKAKLNSNYAIKFLNNKIIGSINLDNIKILNINVMFKMIADNGTSRQSNIVSNFLIVFNIS